MKSLDELEQPSSYQRVRGFGVCYNLETGSEQLHLKTEEFGKRVASVIVSHSLPHYPYCIIHMQATKSIKINKNLRTSEIIQLKYQLTHKILICGDMNASLLSD